jgi:hypothetical protein
VLAGIPQPATLTAVQAQLRRRGKRIGSIHGRLEVLALRGRVSKTWPRRDRVGDRHTSRLDADKGAVGEEQDVGVSRAVDGPSPPKVRTLAGAWGSGNGPATRAGHDPEREGKMSTTYRRRRLGEAERKHRRTAERERVKEAAEQLLTSEGWQRWVRARSMFRRYSARNCMLIALDFHLRGIEPEPVAGFRTWVKLGRCVRKGEHGIRIAAKRAILHRMRSRLIAPSVLPGGV